MLRRTLIAYQASTDAIMIRCGLPITAKFVEADLSPSLPQCSAMTRLPATWYSPFFCPKSLERMRPQGQSAVGSLLCKVVILVDR